MTDIEPEKSDKITSDNTEKPRDLDLVGQQTLIALLTYKTKTAAAKALSVNPDTIYERIKKYKLDKFIAEIPKQALQTLQLGSERAAEVMVESLEDRKVKLDAAREVLDRVGLTGNNKGSTIQVNTQVNLDKYMVDINETN